MFFGQCEDDGLLGVGVFREEALHDGGFFEDLDSEGGWDEGEGGVLEVLDVHVYKGG